MRAPPTSATAGRRGAVTATAAVSRALPALRGKEALARRLMRSADRRGELEGTWTVRLKDGTALELPRQSRMSWAVAFAGVYDATALEYVARFIKPNTVVLDVGASVGLWTVPLGRIAATRNATLWAFEPNPANTPWIRRNTALNRLSETVTVREVGLGDQAESLTLVSAEYGVGNGAIALKEGVGTRKFPRIPVTVERLDDIDLPGPVSFIKIDTEGYEAAFLRGAAALIERDRPVVFGEFATGWLHRRGEDLRSVLIDLDYDVAALTASRSRVWRPVDTIRRRPVDITGPEPLPQDLLLSPKTS
jgi:FkbM family methyltransferase